MLNKSLRKIAASHSFLDFLATFSAAGRGDLSLSATLGALLGGSCPGLHQDALVGLEETLLSRTLPRLPPRQLTVTLQLPLAGLPVLSNAGLGAKDPLEHILVSLANSPVVLTQGLLFHRFCSLLLAATPVPAEGSLRALVNLRQFGADLIVGGAVLVSIEGREGAIGGVGGSTCGRACGPGEGGLGREQFAVVVLGEEFCLEGALASHGKFQLQWLRSFPLQQTLQALLDLALRLVEVDALDALVELLDVGVGSVVLEVDQGLDDLDQVALLGALEAVDGLAQLELVPVDGLPHEALPVVAVDALDVELPLHVARTELDVFLIRADLRQDNLKVGPSNFLDFAIFGAIDELGEVGRQLEKVSPGADVGVEAFHIVVGLLADDEERDAVVGVDVVEGVDVGRHVFEDEHDVVAAVEVRPLVFLKGQRDLLLLLVLPHQLLEILHWFLLPHLLQRLEHLLLIGVLLSVDQVLVDLHLTLVEVTIVVHPQLRCQAVDYLTRLLDQRVVVYLLPTYPRLGVDSQAAVDEVTRLVGKIDPVVVGPHRFDLFQNVVIAGTLIRVSAVEQLVIDHSQRPNISLESVRFFVKDLGSHGQTGAEDGLSDVFGHLFCKAKVSNLANSMTEEHIGDFEIAVHSINFVKSLEAVDDLLEKSSGFILSESFLLIEVLLQVSSVAVLHNNEHALLSGEVIDEVDNILIFTLLEHPHFSLHQFLQLRRVNHKLLRNDLDGDLALVALVNGLVHDRPRTRPQRLKEVVGLELRPLQFLVLHAYTYTRKLQICTTRTGIIRTNPTDHSRCCLLLPHSNQPHDQARDCTLRDGQFRASARCAA